MAIRLSLAILTHNERLEFERLLAQLEPLLIRSEVELLVVDDESGPVMQQFFIDRGIFPHFRRLDGDFGAQRNYAISLCRGDYVLFLDPDEVPAELLVDQLLTVCDLMEKNGMGVCAFPRLNILVDGTDAVHAPEMWHSHAGFDGLDPDYQVRLCRNDGTASWKYSVHEKLVGPERGYKLVPRLGNALIHVKTRHRQANQNQLYDTIDVFSPRNIAKKLRLRRLAVWFGLIREPAWTSLDLVEIAHVPSPAGLAT